MTGPWRDQRWSQEIDTAVAAVRQAGQLCREVQASIDPGTLEKMDRSPVTVADFGSQALVCRAIAEAFPEDPVIGEEDSAALRETGNAGMLERVTGHVRDFLPSADADTVCRWIDLGGAKEYSPRFWTLDPIDGTKGFLRGQQYAISLALIVEGIIEAAVVGCPNLGAEPGSERGDGTLFAAVRGGGAWQLPLTGAGEARPITVSSRTDPRQIRFCESVEAAHSSHGDAARIAAELDILAAPVRLDSQAKYAVVARGEADAYLRLPRDTVYREKIWDHAGGVLVVTEAGGRVTDIEGRKLDFTRGYRLENNLGVIVTNGHVHETVIAAIRDLGIGES